MGAMILAVIFKIWKINFSNVRWKAILSYGMALAGIRAELTVVGGRVVRDATGGAKR